MEQVRFECDRTAVKVLVKHRLHRESIDGSVGLLAVDDSVEVIA